MVVIRVRKSISKNDVLNIESGILSEHIKQDIARLIVKEIIDKKLIQFSFEQNDYEFIVESRLTIDTQN